MRAATAPATAAASDLAWKPNWRATQEHFVRWWQRQGLVIGMWGAPRAATPLEPVPTPPAPASVADAYRDAAGRATRTHHTLAYSRFPLDTLPLASTDIGPGSLALYLGAEPGFAESTVWFHPTMATVEEPESLPPLRFDPANPWWQVTEATLRACVARGHGKYLVGCPDLVENIDILAALRDPQVFAMDLLERPEWVADKVAEIDAAWFAVYERIYQIIKQPDGSSAFGAFIVWGPGRTAKLQCDASVLISAPMYRRFVVPSLTAQCRYLDHSLYHLDGTQAMHHLDALLEINELDAIEWTPQAGIEGGGSPRWYDLYRRILAAGKSVQVCGAAPHEIVPLLDAIGGKGVYILTWYNSEEEAAKLAELVAPYR